MRKIKYKKTRKVQPTLLEYTGIHKTIETEVQLFVYDDLHLVEYENFDVASLGKLVQNNYVNWLNIHGMNDVAVVKQIGDFFKVDQFILSDILNTTKRSKIEHSQNALFFNIKSLLPSEGSDNIDVEQISFLVKEGYLVSFQEKRSDFFTHIRERIRSHSGIVRTKNADYLLYLLLDAIMENFFITIEREEDKVENLINISKQSTDLKILEQIEKHRDNYNFLKRAIIPLRDSLFSIKLQKEQKEFTYIQAGNFTFFERLHQKCLELLEQIDYDLVSLDSAANYFFSAQSHKMNDIMKTLTAVSIFFMPLTFIVGVYGMNFDNMPELHWKYGYFIILGFMLLLLIVMLLYFKKKKWF